MGPQAIGGRFGYVDAGGTFTSGGAEANHTALLTALTDAFPSLSTGGLRGLPSQPTLYLSEQAHHSFHKAARCSGLGTDAVRIIPVGTNQSMEADAVAQSIARDRRDGLAPFLLVATAGTTSAGAIDPLPELAALAAAEDLWLHVDAAWCCGAALVPELRPLLAGIKQADSITFDAHKWLSVPMGAGLFLTRHGDILERTFDLEASYMPREVGHVDPYRHSLQWSRRFIGLKVFLSLAVAGWDGYAAALRHQTAMGDYLRQELQRTGWRVVNDTKLPLVCFDREGCDLNAIASAIVAEGQSWISVTRLGGGRAVLRACVTNYRTGPEDVDRLVHSLTHHRL